MGTKALDVKDESTHSSEQLGLTIWLGPILILIFAIVPFSIAGALTGPGSRRFGASLREIALVCEPFLHGFMGAAAVFATVLVALAAATRFGVGDPSLDVRARAVIGTLVLVCIFSVSVSASATVVVAVVLPGKWVESVTAIVVAWACVLVGQVIGTGATRREQAAQAGEAWRRRKAAGKSHGFSRKGNMPTVGDRVVAEVAIWLTPIVLWLTLGCIVVAGTEALRKYWVIVLPLVALLVIGPMLVVVAWRVTADLSASSTARRVQGGAIGSFGLVVSGILGVVAVTERALAPLGWALLGFAVLHAAVMSISRTRRRLPGVRVIESAASMNGLRASWNWMRQQEARAADAERG